jgi:hypothetical protein
MLDLIEAFLLLGPQWPQRHEMAGGKLAASQLQVAKERGHTFSKVNVLVHLCGKVTMYSLFNFFTKPACAWSRG